MSQSHKDRDRMAMHMGGGKSKLPLLMPSTPRERITPRERLTPRELTRSKECPRDLGSPRERQNNKLTVAVPESPKTTRSAAFYMRKIYNDTRTVRSSVRLQNSPKERPGAKLPSYCNNPRNTVTVASTFRVINGNRVSQSPRVALNMQQSAKEFRSTCKEIENIQQKKVNFRSTTNIQNDLVSNANKIHTHKLLESLTMKFKNQEKLQIMHEDELKIKLENTEKKLLSILNERDALKERIKELQYLLEASQTKIAQTDEEKRRILKQQITEEKDRVIKIFKSMNTMYETTRNLASVLLSNSENKRELSLEEEFEVLLSYFTKPIKICIVLFLYVLLSSNQRCPEYYY